MVFENPGALWLLLALPPFLMALGLWGWRARKEMNRTFSLILPRQKRKHAEKYVLVGVLLGLLIVALASPTVAFSSLAPPVKSGEIILLVDVSASMAAQEGRSSPTRLGRVKPMLHEITDRMAQLDQVRMSLHGFTNLARSHVPFVGKEDYAYLKDSIEKVLDINSTPGKGTSLGQAILNVVDKFSEGDQPKLIVLFSDGEPFVGGESGMSDYERGFIEQAVKTATEEGIQVITVGVGEPEGAKIPITDAQADGTHYAKIKGIDYVTYLEEEGLREIAARTGGQYFYEKDAGALPRFLEESLAPVSAVVAAEVIGYRSAAHWFVLGSLPLWVVFARRHLLA
jgi:Ca-activated chloride channel family protein